MRPYLPAIALLLLPTLIFPGAIPGPRVVSADDHLSVHHAFQTEAGGEVRHPTLSDPAVQFAALDRQVRASLRRGEPPLWTPDIYGGAPLLADQSSRVGSPTSWLAAALPEGMGRDLGIWWILVWTGAGTALLARALGCRPWAAAAAGAAATTGPYLSVWLLHPPANTLCWIPWVLWTLETRRWGWLSLATAGMLCGGHAETAFAGLLFAAGWWLLRSRAWRAVPAMLCGALLSMPILLPFLEQLQRSATLAAHGGNTLPPAYLADLIWPGWLGHPVTGNWRGGSWPEAQLHPGPAALALAILGLRRGRWLWAAWAACIAAAIHGLPGPINDARMASIGASWLALAAGFGADRLPRRWTWLAFIAVAASGTWARRLDQDSLPPERHAPAPAPWTQALRTLLRCPQGDDPVGCGRVIGLGWALQPNTGALAGLRDLRGYDLPVSRDTERLEAALDPRLIRPWFPIAQPPARGLLDFSATRVLLSPEPIDDPPGPALDLGDAPLSAYALDLEAPRAWLATAPQRAGSPDEALARLRDGRGTRARPPVEQLPGQWPRDGTATPLRVTERGSTEVRIALPGRRGAVILADAWAPGWQASIDGTPADCLRAGGYFRAAIVDRGDRELIFRYRPAGWRWGLGLAALGALGGLLLARGPLQSPS